MIKDFLLVRARPDLEAGKLEDYLQFNHAPLAMSSPALAREMQRYTMNHVRAGRGDDICLYPALGGLVTVVEHLMGGWEGVARFSADAHYQAQVQPDEQIMLAMMDGAPQFVAILEEHPVFDGVPRGPLKMLDFVRRPHALSRKDFLERLREDGAWARQDDAYRAAVSRRVHSIAGPGAAAFAGDGEPFDAVIEAWVSDPERLIRIMERQRNRRAAFCDPERSITALTEEHWIHGESDAFGARIAAGIEAASAGQRAGEPALVDLGVVVRP